MASIEQLDAFFTQLSTRTVDLFPDGILDVNVKSLHSLHLLSEKSFLPTMALQTIESTEKITLFNERYALWIAPKKEATPPMTIVYIARKTTEGLVPEIAFRAMGIHNRPKTILQVIDRLLTDIQETNSVISKLEHD